MEEIISTIKAQNAWFVMATRIDNDNLGRPDKTTIARKSVLLFQGLAPSGKSAINLLAYHAGQFHFVSINSILSLQQSLKKEQWDAVIFHDPSNRTKPLDALAVVRANSSTIPFILVVDQIEMGTAVELVKAGVHDIVLENEIQRLAVSVDQAVSQTVAVAEHSNLSHVYGDLLKTILNAIPAPIFYKNENGVYLGCNEAFLNYLGLPEEKIVGKTVYDVAPKELADVYFKADQDLLASRGTQFYEAKVAYADGTVHEVMFHKAVFNKLNGNVGGQVGVMLDITERKRLERELEKMAGSDSLTGAYNRRSFMQLSETEIQRAKRSNKPLSFFYMDIDFFKEINDQYGHHVGDEVLVRLVVESKKLLREHDILARTGGEEFAVTLPETSLAEAMQVAERLRAVTESIKVPTPKGYVSFTVSIGVAECAYQTEYIENALHRADEALYVAKNGGRNKVICSIS